MATTAILQIVEAPAASPTVRLGLTTSPAWLGTLDSFDLGVPQFSAEPEAVGVDYGWRTAVFDLKLIGTYSQVATTMQAIARELLRDSFWLMVQWQGAPNKAIFLKAYRSAPASLQWQEAAAGVWTLPLSLTCDPWLYGPQESIGPVTITNDPASGTNKAFYKFSTIKGDAPTPLLVSVNPSGDLPPDSRIMLATAALDPAVSPTGPVVVQNDDASASWSAGADTTESTADASMSGGTRATVTFATTPGMAWRLRGYPNVQPLPGVHKALVRVARSDTSSTFALRLGMGDGFNAGPVYPCPTAYFDFPTSPATGMAAWIDLGEFSFPRGLIGKLPVSETFSTQDIHLEAERLSGTGSLYIDAILFVPVRTSASWDARIIFSQFDAGYIYDGTYLEWDGQEERLIKRAVSTGLVTPASSPLIVGGWPRLTPGATNIFHLLLQTNGRVKTDVTGANSTDVITKTSAVTFKYYPRYLHLRPEAD